MDNKKKKSKKKIVIILVAVIAVVIVIAILMSRNAKNSVSEYGEVGVEAMPLAMQDLSETINVTGKVESQNVWVATTELTSVKVKDLNVSLGDRVSEGDVLCTFDEADLSEQISSLEQQISESENQSRITNSNAITEAQMGLRQAQQSEKDQIATAEAEYEAAKKAYQEGKKKKKEGLSKSEKIRLNNELDAAEKAVESAQAALGTAQLAYQDGLGKDLSMSESIALAQAVKDAENGVASAKQALELTRATYDETMEKGSITDTELTTLKNAYETAKRNLKSVKETTAKAITSAENSLNAAEANAEVTTSSSDTELAKMKRQLSQMTISAGQSGVVTQLNVSKGSIATGNLMKIEDDSALKVNVTISEKDIVKIKEGMEAVITTNALPDEEVKGKITQVINFSSGSISSSSSDYGTSDSSSSSGSSYSAMIELEPGSKLLLGMTVKVSIAINEEAAALSVPYDSIYYDENGDTAVMRATENNKGTYDIEKVPVTLGNQNDYYTAIEGDVAEGDLIVLYPYMVNDGDSTELTVIDGSGGLHGVDSTTDETVGFD